MLRRLTSCFAVVIVALGAVVAAGTPVSAQTAVSAEDISVRDQTIACWGNNDRGQTDAPEGQ